MKILLIVPLFLLGGCSLLQGNQEVHRVLNEMVANGTITHEQYEVLLQALGGGGLGDVLRTVGDGALALVLGYFGIKNAPKIFTKKKPATPA